MFLQQWQKSCRFRWNKYTPSLEHVTRSHLWSYGNTVFKCPESGGRKNKISPKRSQGHTTHKRLFIELNSKYFWKEGLCIILSVYVMNKLANTIEQNRDKNWYLSQKSKTKWMQQVLIFQHEMIKKSVFCLVSLALSN